VEVIGGSKSLATWHPSKERPLPTELEAGLTRGSVWTFWKRGRDYLPPPFLVLIIFIFYFRDGSFAGIQFTRNLPQHFLYSVCACWWCRVFTILLTNSVEWSLCWEINSSTVGQEIYHILCIPNVKCIVCKCRPLVLILNQIKSTPSQPAEC